MRKEFTHSDISAASERPARNAGSGGGGDAHIVTKDTTQIGVHVSSGLAGTFDSFWESEEMPGSDF